MNTVSKVVVDSMSEGLKLIRDRFGPDALIVKTLKRRGRLELYVEFDSNEESDYSYVDDKNRSEFEHLLTQAQERPANSSVGNEFVEEERRAPGQRTTEAYRQAKARMLRSVIDSDETLAPVHNDKPTATFEDKTRGNENVSVEIQRSAQDNISTFNSILRNVTEYGSSGQEDELTVKGLIEDLQLHPRIAARLLDCKRIDEVLSRLQNMINVVEVKLVRQGLHAFVGPAGGGKTTTLIKLVTRQVKAIGPESTAIVGCDNYRAGAMQQLGRIAKLLGVPFLRVGVDYSLEQALEKTASCQFVAIDMPGLGLNDPDLQFELDRLEKIDRDISRLLVLPAYLQADVMDLVLKRYIGQAGPSRLILSRLDECCTLGPAISLLINTGLPLAYTTSGPHIPEDIEVANGNGLIRNAMQLLGGRVAKAHNSDFTNSSNEVVSQL